MIKFVVFLFSLLSSSNVFAAADSYRWFHVSIDNVWAIFIFLLPMVLFPLLLMVILYWRFSGNRMHKNSSSEDN